jgi:hypothetical protein
LCHEELADAVENTTLELVNAVDAEKLQLFHGATSQRRVPSERGLSGLKSARLSRAAGTAPDDGVIHVRTAFVELWLSRHVEPPLGAALAGPSLVKAGGAFPAQCAFSPIGSGW